MEEIFDQLSWPSWSTPPPPPPEPEPEVLDRLIVLALILCSTFLLHRIVQVNIILTGISAMIWTSHGFFYGIFKH